MESGPPSVKPNWFFCNCRLGVPALFALKPFAFRTAFCRNSCRLPWNSFVPDLIV